MYCLNSKLKFCFCVLIPCTKHSIIETSRTNICNIISSFCHYRAVRQRLGKCQSLNLGLTWLKGLGYFSILFYFFWQMFALFTSLHGNAKKCDSELMHAAISWKNIPNAMKILSLCNMAAKNIKPLWIPGHFT